MKRICILFLVFTLVFSLAACGNTGSGPVKDHAVSEENLTPPSDPSGKEDVPEQVSKKGTANTGEDSAHNTENGAGEAADDASEREGNSDMKMRIGDTAVPVTWEQNESVDALRQLVRENSLVIQMSMYGGFEQVGPIGQSLPRDDVQTTTGPGDIVLYAGNQIVIFYGSNSWAYTRLGHVDLTEREMSDLLSKGDVVITLE